MKTFKLQATEDIKKTKTIAKRYQHKKDEEHPSSRITQKKPDITKPDTSKNYQPRSNNRNKENTNVAQSVKEGWQ